VDVVLLGKCDGMDLGLEELLEDSVTNGIPVVGDIVGFGNDESRFFSSRARFQYDGYMLFAKAKLPRSAIAMKSTTAAIDTILISASYFCCFVSK